MRRKGTALEQALEASGDHAGGSRSCGTSVPCSGGMQTCQSGRGGAGLAARRRRGAAGGGREDAPRRGRVGGVLNGAGADTVDAAIVRCQEIRAILSGDPWAEALALEPLASLHAMRGEFASCGSRAAGTVVGRACGVRADRGRGGWRNSEAFVATLAGDLERAEHVLRTGCRVLEQMGERAVLASTEGCSSRR